WSEEPASNAAIGRPPASTAYAPDSPGRRRGVSPCCSEGAHWLEKSTARNVTNQRVRDTPTPSRRSTRAFPRRSAALPYPYRVTCRVRYDLLSAPANDNASRLKAVGRTAPQANQR